MLINQTVLMGEKKLLPVSCEFSKSDIILVADAPAIWGGGGGLMRHNIHLLCWFLCQDIETTIVNKQLTSQPMH